MSDADSTRTTSEDHTDHASGHDPSAAGERLGPIAVTTWAYAIIGAVSGLVLAVALFVAGAS